MRELTDRALSTAATRGASYADVRVVRRLEESIAVKTGRRRGRGQRRDRGLRRSASSSTAPGGSRARTGSRPPRSTGSPPQAVRIARASATALRRPVEPRRSAAGPRHATRRRSRRTRSRSPSRRRSATCSPPTRPLRRVDGDRLHRDRRTAPSASGRRSPPATAASPSRRSPTSAPAIEANAIDGDEHQRRSYPDAGGGWQGRRLRVRPRARPGRHGRAAGRGGGRAPVRAAVPAGPAHDRPRPLAALPPGPRELRPPDRARPGLRHRGVLRRARAS